MITKFETGGGVAHPNTAGKGSNTLIYIVVGAVLLYLGYRYIIKPQMDKNKKNESAPAQ